MRPLSRLAGTTKGLTINRTTLDGRTWAMDDGLMIPSTLMRGDEEPIGHDFDGYITSAYKRNGIVFTCVLARLLPFSEARFQFQRLDGGRPGDLFDAPALDILKRPWPNGTTGDLLARMEQDASLAGNFYAAIVGTGASRRLRRLRPDWVTIISGVSGDVDGSPWALDGQVLGYLYQPRSRTGDKLEPILLTPDRIAHYAPIPDPAAQWRGMSWLTPVLLEIQADVATTKHKLKFFENGGTPSYAIRYDKDVSAEAVRKAAAFFKEQHSGLDNAYRILHLGGGADPVSVGANLQQLDFKATQGAGETRIAAAAGVGAIIGRLSEGMQGSSLNAGNYAAAKRQFGDMTVRPLWRNAAGALEKFTPPPAGARLWYDARDVALLAEDQKDLADIQARQAETIARLTDAGFTPPSVVAAVRAGDFTLLQHSGLFSVQLQQAGSQRQPEGGP